MSKTATTKTLAEQAAESREALAQARSAVPALAQAVDAAEQAVEDIADAWLSGDDTPTALAYTTAQAEHVKATMLHKAAVSLVGRRERALINDDLTLAVLLGQALGDSMGVEARAIGKLETPRLSDFTTADVPALFIVQNEPTSTNRMGMFTGRVEMVFIRSKLHAKPDYDAIDEAFHAAGYSVEISPNFRTQVFNEAARLYENRARFVVHKAFDGAPFNRKGINPESIGNAIAASLAHELRDRSAPGMIRVGGEDSGAPRRVKLTSAKVASERVRDDGVTETVVSYSLNVLPHGSSTPSQLVARVERILSSLTGTVDMDWAYGVADSVSLKLPESRGNSTVELSGRITVLSRQS